MAITVEELVSKLGLEVDESGFEVARKVMESLHKGLLGLVGAAAAYAGGIQVLMRSTRAQADEALKNAQATGTTTEKIQELDFAAEESGVSVEALHIGLGRLSRSAFEAQHGSEQARAAFYRLGVGAYDSRGKLKDVDGLLTSVAERFHKLPDGIEKTALATELFGRGGRELIPMLNKGKEGIAELREEAHELGYVLSNETIAQAHAWTLADRRLEAALKGLRNEIAGPLLASAGQLAIKVAEFIRLHKSEVADVIRKPYEILVRVMGDLKTIFTEVYNVVDGLITKLGGNTKTGIVAGLIAAAALTFAWLIPLGLIVLVVDEIATTLRGGDSLINRLAKSSEKWMDSFGTGTDFLDHISGALKFQWYVLTHIYETWQEIVKLFEGKGQVFAWLSYLSGSSGAGKAAEEAFGLPKGAGADLQSGVNANVANRNVSHGPGAGTTALQRTGAAIESAVGTVQTFGNIIVNIGGTSATPKDIQDAVAKGVRDELARRNRATLATLGSPPASTNAR